MADTPVDHAQADLRVSDIRISADFVEALNRARAPLPWADHDNQIVDADGYIVCDVEGRHATEIAAMIVVAVNTCGSFRATRRSVPPNVKGE